MANRLTVGVITFHDTPNYGGTLQCYATSAYLSSRGAEVEVINYNPPHTSLQYIKNLFLGRQRSFDNVRRVQRFFAFGKERLRYSGGYTPLRSGLRALARRYDLAITGSDEVWKIDHMRRFDPSYYLDFCEPESTRIVSYAASASMVTDLITQADKVGPLLERFDAISVRDPETRDQVAVITGREPEMVVDPTLLWDWEQEILPPLVESGYVAVYSYLTDPEMDTVRSVAHAKGFKVVCFGCRHSQADINLAWIGPEEWLRVIKHADLVVTNFFHGAVFALLFGRPLFAHVNPAKRLKLERIMMLAGLDGRLHSTVNELANIGIDACAYDRTKVEALFAPMIVALRRSSVLPPFAVWPPRIRRGAVARKDDGKGPFD
jgi:hypothetical protein